MILRFKNDFHVRLVYRLLLGNLIRTTDETGVTDYTYDELARVIQEQITGKNQGETAGSGIVVKKYGYDRLSRVTSFELYNNSTLEQGVEYGYNELGQLTSLREDGANYGYEYDKVGRLIKEINPVTNVDTAYTYYASGDVRSIITDRIENSAFDAVSIAPIERTEYEYDKLGNVLTKLENKVGYTYSYDKLNRLSASHHDNMTETYSYDKYGNLLKQETALTQPTGSAINLLTTSTDYSYDANNRLTKMRYDEGEASYSRKTSTHLAYDKEGNLIEKSKWNESGMYGGSKGETDYYRYNGFNQLAEFEKDSGLAQNEKYYYYYNAGGLRAKKVKEDLGAEIGTGTGSTALEKSSDISGIAAQLSAPDKAFTTNYYYKGGKLVLETDGQGATTAKTLHGINLIKREVMNVQGMGLVPTEGGSWGNTASASPSASASSSAKTSPGSAIDKNGNLTYFFVQNGRGDVIKLLNENGDIIRDYEYEPFGKEQDIKTEGYGADYFTAKWKQEVEDNAIDNPFRFGGEYKDEESGNYYLRARYYDPEIQRFTQEDTYSGTLGNPMSQNGYAFCGNNPVNFVDPTGHVYTSWDKANGVNKSVVDKATSDYNKAKAKGDKAGMNKAHADAEAARESAHKSTNTKGSASGYTYEKSGNGNLTLNSVDRTLLKTITKSGYSSMNGSSYIPAITIASKNTGNISNNVLYAGAPNAYTQLIEDSSKLNILMDYMDVQKNPQAAQQGAWDAFNQNLMAWSFVGGGALEDAVSLTVKNLLKKESLNAVDKKIENSLSQQIINGLKNAKVEYKNGQPYLKQFKVSDDYKVILRRDFDEFSHGDMNHWNIELQTTKGNIKFNQHLYVDELGKIIP